MSSNMSSFYGHPKRIIESYASFFYGLENIGFLLPML